MSDFIFYIYVLYTYFPITLVSCRPGFLCFLSVTCKYFQVVAILGAAGWVFISLFFIFSFNSFGEEGNIQLQNIACFYINQILFAQTRGNGCFSLWFVLRNRYIRSTLHELKQSLSNTSATQWIQSLMISGGIHILLTLFSFLFFFITSGNCSEYIMFYSYRERTECITN